MTDEKRKETYLPNTGYRHKYVHIHLFTYMHKNRYAVPVHILFNIFKFELM